LGVLKWGPARGDQSKKSKTGGERDKGDAKGKGKSW